MVAFAKYTIQKRYHPNDTILIFSRACLTFLKTTLFFSFVRTILEHPMLVSSKKNLRPRRNKVNYRKKRPYRKTFKFWIMKGKLERDWQDSTENYCDYEDCCTFNYFRTFKLAGHEWMGYQCRKCGQYEIWRTNPSGIPGIMVKVESDRCDFWSKLNEKKKNG